MNELIQKAMQLRQESEQVEKQIDFISQQLFDLQEFHKNLNYLNIKSSEKIMSPLGRGVFVEAEMSKDSKLLVEVGAGIFVKKTSQETAEIIEAQIKKFREYKIQLETQLQEYISEFYEMLQEVEEMKK
jgi:prefoldin alpha subunit